MLSRTSIKVQHFLEPFKVVEKEGNHGHAGSGRVESQLPSKTTLSSFPGMTKNYRIRSRKGNEGNPLCRRGS